MCFMSLLSELRYFDVTSGALIPDVMHDVCTRRCFTVRNLGVTPRIYQH